MSEVQNQEGHLREFGEGEGMGGWAAYTIEQLMDVQNGFAFKSGEYIEEGQNTFEVLKMGHIEKGGGLRKNPKKDYVQKAENLKRWVLNKGDIVMAMTDMKDSVVILGVPAMIDRSDHYVLNQRVARLTIKKCELVDAEFIYNYLKWEDFLFKLQSKASSGVQVNLSTSTIKESIVKVPPLPEQKTIAAVLSSLDDKIDLLHRQNQVLEAMAETLFRQWFVEEAGEDWQDGKFADYAEHLKVNAKPASNPLQMYMHYSLPAFDAGMFPVVEAGSEIMSNKYGIEPWTILVSKLNPRFPRIWPIGESTGENAICSTEFQVFKPKDEELYGYLYFFLKSNDAREELSMAASGTSGSHQRVRPEDILNLRVSIPSTQFAEKFSGLVMPGIRKSMMNLQQIQSLEKLRNSLLPKLMSGEVRVAY